MENVNFHAGVELLLKRMDSNPQEFESGGGKWRALIETNTRWMSKEEKEAVNTKLRKISLDSMRTYMMKQIFSDKERELQYAQKKEAPSLGAGGSGVMGSSAGLVNTGVTSSLNAPPPVWGSTSAGLMSNSITVGDIRLEDSEVRTLKQMLEDYTEEHT